MMFLLLQALDNLFETGFEHTLFRVPDVEPGEYRSPSLYIGAIPPRRSGDDKEGFPYIVNRVVSGNDSATGSKVTVYTICGIYSAEKVEGAENDILNMVARCRAILLSMENGILENRFRFEYPLTWSMGIKEEQHMQPYPYAGATIISQWEVPAVEFNIPLEDQDKVYGYFR